jgi:hypothetical protein
MGKGRSAPDQWVAVVKPGRVLFEMEGVASGGARGDEARGGETAVLTKFAVRFAGEDAEGGELRDMGADELDIKGASSPISCSGCASRSRWSSWKRDRFAACVRPRASRRYCGKVTS